MLFKKLNFNHPDQLNDWLKQLNEEKRHRVGMCLAMTRIFTKFASYELNKVPNDVLVAF